MRGFLASLREGLTGFFRRFTRGLQRTVLPALVGREAYLRRVGIRPALRKFDEERPDVWKFGPRGYDWVTVETPAPAVGQPLRPDQMHVADVVLVGPDGQFMTVNNIFLPTGRAFDLRYFERRLAAELKRMEREGLIDPIGPDPTGYVRRSTMDFNLYTMTAV